MWAFIGVTFALFAGLAYMMGSMRREEIIANWKMYRADPVYMFSAPLFKPSDDPRSPVQFAIDNFYDVVMGMINDVFLVFLEPVFKIFRLFLDAISQSGDGLFNIKALLSNMWDKWNKIVDPFMRRFQTVFHRFRLTFVKLFTAMQKTLGVAVSAVYAGLSTITTMLSFMDLMVNIIISILITLLILVILPPFILIPILPLIIAAIVMVSQTASAGGVQGMAETFCFGKGTTVRTLHGDLPIEDIYVGDTLYTGGRVVGVMKFQTTASDLYRLYNVVVSGSHIVYQNGSPMHVKDHPDALSMGLVESELYCLMTSDKQIPIVSDRGIVMFADWEEISGLEDLRSWHQQVYESLNPHKLYQGGPSIDVLYSESVFSERTDILTPSGWILLNNLHPGDEVLDASGNPTRIVGKVQVDGLEVQTTFQTGENSYCSSAIWMYDNDEWGQVKGNPLPHSETMFYSLFTESGTFQIRFQGIAKPVRDFTDIGPNRIHETYEMVMDRLKQKLDTL